MKKCRYSINGKCTNDNVTCDICYSSNNEMISCAPLQRSIVIYDDNWLVEMKEDQEKEIKSIANERISFLIEELMSVKKLALGNDNCPYYRSKRRCEIEDIYCEECKEQYFDKVKEELLTKNLLK